MEIKLFGICRVFGYCVEDCGLCEQIPVVNPVYQQMARDHGKTAALARKERKEELFSKGVSMRSGYHHVEEARI